MRVVHVWIDPPVAVGAVACVVLLPVDAVWPGELVGALVLADDLVERTGEVVSEVDVVGRMSLMSSQDRGTPAQKSWNVRARGSRRRPC